MQPANLTHITNLCLCACITDLQYYTKDFHLLNGSSKLLILIGVISSATLKCPTNRAKKTISCSSVNLMFSACIMLDQFTVSNHFNYANTKSRNTLRKPCPSPSYSTRETGKPFSFKAWKIVLACFGGTAYKVKLDSLFKLS